MRRFTRKVAGPNIVTQIGPKISAPVMTATGPGTPAANTIYKDQVGEAWAYVGATGGLKASFNVSSVTTSGPGVYKVNFARPFASPTSYIVSAITVGAVIGYAAMSVTGQILASGAVILVRTATGGAGTLVNSRFMMIAKGRH